jgi:glycosyltransferase involved in cell wall biosynthesis
MLERIPGYRMVILNQGDHKFIRSRIASAGVSEALVTVKAVDFVAVAQEMSRMSCGVFFIKPVFSKQGSLATKMAEFLACGVPCLCNGYVEDVRAIIQGERVGVILDDFSPPAVSKAVDSIISLCLEPGIRGRCRRAAEAHFSLEQGVQAYQEIYESITARR